MLEFFAPWFALLLPLPFFVRYIAPRSNKTGTPEIHFPAIDRLKKAFPRTSGKGTKGLFALLFTSWVFLIIALMQPERVDQWKQVVNKGYDLMLAVDISGSMQAVDFSTATKVINRLDAAKDVVSKFVIGRRGDRVGLITFAENAYLHVPLTLDTISVSRMLNDTVFGMAGNGTAIGDAIGLAIRTLRERPAGSRVLVLLTDGEDNSSSLPPLEAAKLAKQYGIRVYTVGIGKKGPVPFPTQFGGYAMGESPLDEALLIQIAENTGGKFFLAADKNTLEQIYKQIDAFEKTDAETTIHYTREPLYYYPLSASALILLFATTRRRHASFC